MVHGWQLLVLRVKEQQSPVAGRQQWECPSNSITMQYILMSCASILYRSLKLLAQEPLFAIACEHLVSFMMFSEWLHHDTSFNWLVTVRGCPSPLMLTIPGGPPGSFSRRLATTMEPQRSQGGAPGPAAKVCCLEILQLPTAFLETNETPMLNWLDTACGWTNETNMRPGVWLQVGNISNHWVPNRKEWPKTIATPGLSATVWWRPNDNACCRIP